MGLGKEKKTTTIILADGQEYKMSPLNLNLLCEVEDKFGAVAEEVFKKPSMKVMRCLIYLLLKPNHPDITEEMVGELVDMKVIEGIKNILGV